MILVAIADEATIADLDRYKSITARLADPRKLGDDEARRLIASGKPIYWATGAMHSPETGSPEMLMELAYRLAVEDTPAVRAIREHVITLLTPVLEVDGRDRMVDLVRWHQANPDAGMPPLAYWGHYVSHDNNRDAIGVALALSRNVLAAFSEWHPQVLHDLHESVPFLYVSTGTGPYNAWLDPLMVDEWERMADHEVGELTRRGLPGVWTHGFYDGWAPNYMFWVAMGRNAIGRFYETFGNALPDTEDRVVRRESARDWFRPNPPLPAVRWSLRDNVNYEQSGLLLALGDMAERREHFLEQFYLLGERSVAKARTEGPAAYVFPSGQKRLGQLRDVLDLLRRQGVEVSVAERAFTVTPEWPPRSHHDEKSEPAPSSSSREGGNPVSSDDSGSALPRGRRQSATPAADEPLSFPAGSFVVRMDQPYSRLADTLLDTQYVRPEDRVYDDTGWTLGYTRNVEWKRVVNPAVLDVPMHAWDGKLPAAAGATALEGAAVAIENAAETDVARLRWRLPDARMLVADEPIKGKTAWPAGTVIVPLDGAGRAAVREALAALALRWEPLPAMPRVASHELARPRIALLHTWLDTQDEGWYRLALEDLRVPYTYISTQDVAREPDLRARFDVILFPPADSSPQEIVNGLPPGPPLPWKKTELTPNLGVDTTDDMRPGLGIAGVANLTRFVAAGGLLVTVRDTARFAVEFGLARWVHVVDTAKLRAPGTILRASVADPASPVAYGYDATVPVYFSRGPVFRVGAFEPEREDKRPSGRGGKDDPDVPQGRAFVAPPERPTPGPGEEGFQLPDDYRVFYEPYLPRTEDRPRVIVAFPKQADTLLLSGMLDGADEIAGKALVVDAPLGKGHVLLFGCNPVWRASTQGTYALVMNAVMSWDHLGVGWPPKPAR